MKYAISLSEDGKHIRIRVFEAITGDMEREFAANAIEEARRHGLRKFLVDVRGTSNVAATLEQFTLGHKDMDEFALDRSSRIAILADAADRSHDFIETVFLNAGFDCRLFSTEDAALKWLEE
jgi:hypothetical protein